LKLEKDNQNIDVFPMGKFLRTPIATGSNQN